MKTPKIILPRALALQDIETAIAYYLRQNARRAAEHFVDALEKAYHHISLYPDTGSTRYAQELKLPRLRAWPLNRYPYLIFYIEQAEHIDVWRGLHKLNDVPAWMQDEE